MPLVDFTDASLWDGSSATSLCRVWNGDNPPTYSGFTRANRQALIGNDGFNLVKALESVGMAKGEKICLVGGGFGWVTEDFITAGYARARCADSSSWIHADKVHHAAIPIINADIITAAGQVALKTAFNLQAGEKLDWVITEDVLPCLNDAEVIAFVIACRKMGAKVAHWLTPKLGPSQDARLNWKSIVEWKTMVAPNYVIQRGKSVVA